MLSNFLLANDVKIESFAQIQGRFLLVKVHSPSGSTSGGVIWAYWREIPQIISRHGAID